ncbi:MAG: sigma-70 family RNA polymerase sigma factor [Acidimicrobiia bacterium]|nr:sigma-70 family RNA polymerase sigma factor [Acidimicrobiia bacterium]
MWLVHACGWTHAECAEAMSISASAVSAHVGRALAALRHRLEVDDGRHGTALPLRGSCRPRGGAGDDATALGIAAERYVLVRHDPDDRAALSQAPPTSPALMRCASARQTRPPGCAMATPWSPRCSSSSRSASSPTATCRVEPSRSTPRGSRRTSSPRASRCSARSAATAR